MLKEKRGVLTALDSYIDMLINLIAILTGYLFTVMLKPEAEAIGIFRPTGVGLVFLNVIAASFIYHVADLYPRGRYSRPLSDFPSVLRSNLLYFGIASPVFALRVSAEYRDAIFLWLFLSAAISTLFITFKRRVARAAIAFLRSKNFHLRKVVIIGDSTAAAEHFVREVESNSEYGIVLVGYVGDRLCGDCLGIPRLGSITNIGEIFDKHRPTEVVFAVSDYDKRRVIRLVNLCDDRCIKVYFLPVIYGFFKNSGQIESLGSLPLVNLHRTPLDNLANEIMKRSLDVIGSVVLIILSSPVMLFAAVGVRLSSPGPILFKQTRVGRLGKSFNMLKFRSMRVNKESDKAWTTGSDPRKTRFGTFLRRTAIDELPQLFNVLAGSMSLVGPRPEIPVFVEHFRNTVPLYMVKHYVKPGITGLAQIKGLRGDTSVEERIEEDIEYIESWSLWLDIVILLKTPFKAFNKNEKYTGEV